MISSEEKNNVENIPEFDVSDIPEPLDKPTTETVDTVELVEIPTIEDSVVEEKVNVTTQSTAEDNPEVETVEFESTGFSVDFDASAMLKPIDKLSKRVADVLRGKKTAMVFFCDLCQLEMKIYQHKNGFEPARICVHYQFLGVERGKE